MQQDIIWITGASSGIGLALTTLLASRGHQLIISSRNVAALENIAKPYSNVQVLAFDVSDSSTIENTKTQLQTMAPHLDCVILNAGDCEYFDPLVPDWSMMARIAHVNYLGLVNSVHICLDHLKKAKQPYLLGVSSLVIHTPFPRAEAYGASKAAVNYFLNSLRLDIAQFGIDVTSIQPGFVDTPLTRKNNFPMPFLLTAADVAQRITDVVEKPRHKRPLTVYFPRRLLCLLTLINLFPRRWIARQQDRRACVDTTTNNSSNGSLS